MKLNVFYYILNPIALQAFFSQAPLAGIDIYQNGVRTKRKMIDNFPAVQAANSQRRRAGIAMGAPTLSDPAGELGRRPHRNPGPPPILASSAL